MGDSLWIIMTEFCDLEIWGEHPLLYSPCGPLPSRLLICLSLIHAVSHVCSSGRTPTACLCWKWRTWWSWVTNPTPSVSSPTYSPWSTTCAGTRCPWVGPVTSDLCSVSAQPPCAPPSPNPWPPPLAPSSADDCLCSERLWSQTCTSPKGRWGIVCVCVCVSVYLCWQWWCVYSLFQLSSGHTLLALKFTFL